MRPIALVIALLATSEAHAAARTLTLADAVELALKADPLVAQARVAQDRSKNAVLRAQLDRISFKVDGQLQELWNKSNIGGPPVPALCTVGGVTTALDAQACTAVGGTSFIPEQSPEFGQGLFNLSAQLSVPVFSGLRVESNVSMRQRLRDATLVQLRQSTRDTALATTRAYWAVRRLALLREVQAATIDRLRQAEDITGARLRAGLSPPIDKNRATLRLLQQQAQLADLDGQLRQASAQLGVSLGVDDELVLVDVPMVPEGLPPPVEGLLEDAHKGRPELAVARLYAEAQHYAVRIARSNFFPQLGVFGLFQYGNNPYIVGSGARSASDSANPFTNLSGNLSLGANLSMNFFDTLNTWTGMKDALYEEDRLQLERKRVARIVDAEVRIAHAKVLHLQGRRTPLASAREVARDNLTILEARYKNGDALVIEFLDAQNELTNLELQLADVTAQLHLAWLELEASLGKVLGASR
jgi:outer membrane protein TolC